MGFHPEARNSLIWTFGYLMSNKRYSLVFTTKRIINDVSVIRGWCKILLRAIGFHPEDNYIRFSVFEVDTRFSFGLLAFTPKKLYMGLRLSGCLSLMQDSPSGHWFSLRKKLYMRFRLSDFDARSPFGLLTFTPKRHSIWDSAIYVLCKILLQIIGLHHEATLYMGFGNLWFMQDPPSDYWSSPRSTKHDYI